MMTAELVGVVLAGGASQRMGTDKALLPHPRGKTFLGHAVQLMRDLCQTVVVAGRAPDPAVDPDSHLVWLREDPPPRGPIVGLVAAMQYAAQLPEAQAVFVIPVDMPELQSEALAELKRQFQKSPDRLVAITFDGQFAEPLLAIYPLRFTDSLKQCLLSGDRSLSRWLRRQSVQLVSLAGDPVPNLNTPDQFDAWHRHPPNRKS